MSGVLGFIPQWRSSRKHWGGIRGPHEGRAGKTKRDLVVKRDWLPCARLEGTHPRHLMRDQPWAFRVRIMSSLQIWYLSSFQG